MAEARLRFALPEILLCGHIYDILERLAIHDIRAYDEAGFGVQYAPFERLVQKIILDYEKYERKQTEKNEKPKVKRYIKREN